MRDFHEIPEPKGLICRECGSELKEISTTHDNIFLTCPGCKEEISRLSDIESYIEEIQLRYNHLLKKYEVLSQLERNLQDFIKTLQR